jgi:WD40 repeat protein
MESSEDGHIRIWHFHGGLLLNKIRVSKGNINGISLYNDKYAFVGTDDQNIKLIDLEEGSIIKKLHAHSKEVLNVGVIFTEKYGNILISQAYDEEQIKIWSIDN